MNVAVILSPRDYDVVLGHAPDLRLTRVFRLNDATDGGTHRDVTGDSP